MTENYSNKCTTLARVNEICDSTDAIILNDYYKTVGENESLEQKIQNNIDILKSDIDHNMIKVLFIYFIYYILFIYFYYTLQFFFKLSKNLCKK